MKLFILREKTYLTQHELTLLSFIPIDFLRVTILKNEDKWLNNKIYNEKIIF